MIGTSIAHYRIEEKIGEGGMGEVYRAHDTKLNRDVALKILPQIFAQDSQRMARFEREAQVLASLNHSHIAQIHGLEETEGTKALVLELVEGETLQEQIARGPIPVDEALKIALQICEGLEAAHEKGIIHRDLKPANIKITPEGQVKILDFGLAKALEGEAPVSDLSHSPTLTHQSTQAGVILGTASYMSPEQARGKPVDKRTDIWAFGAVLYEMLTGKKAFAGEDVSDTLAEILKTEPDWTVLPSTAQPTVQFIMSRCLEKDSKKRFRDVGDVAIQLEEASIERPDRNATSSSPRFSRRIGLLSAVGIGAVLGALVYWGLSRGPDQSANPYMRFEMNLTEGGTLGRGFQGPPLTVSSDGRFAAFEIGAGSETSISIRSMDDFEVRPVPGSERGRGPFFSPDGQWLGFLTENSIKKVSTQGGSPRSVCDDCLDNARGAFWASNDTIVYAPSLDSGIWKVSVDGGTPSPLTELDLSRNESSHRWPQLLPEARALLFTIGAEGHRVDSKIVVRRLETGETKVLVEGGTYGRIISTGHLLYFHEGTMMAVAFDIERLRTLGSPVRLLEGISQNPSSGAPRCDFSSESLLVYLANEVGKALDNVTLTWWGRDGKSVALPLPSNNYLFPDLSPDGSRVALSFGESSYNLWVYEFSNGSLNQFTFEASNSGAVWSPSGKQIAFYSTRTGPWNLFWKSADFSSEAEQLIETTRSQRPSSFHPSGKWLAFTDVDPITKNGDISILNFEKMTAEPFLNSPSFEGGAMFSPDGKWIAYTSDESGQYEVYVRPFPGPGGQQRITLNGGQQPTWSPDGREIFFLRNDQKTLMSARIEFNEETLSLGRPMRLLQLNRYSGIAPPERSHYLVSKDGQRFLVPLDYDPEQIKTPVRAVLNWFEELKRLVPTE